MPAIDFPSNPAINDIFTSGTKSWVWTGTVWNSIFESVGGATITVSATAPESPADGDLWLDTTISRVKVYYNLEWTVIANYSDTLVIPEHTHDTSIDGTGLITATFINGGDPSSPQLSVIDAGNSSTTDWSETYNGGLVTA